MMSVAWNDAAQRYIDRRGQCVNDASIVLEHPSGYEYDGPLVVECPYCEYEREQGRVWCARREPSAAARNPPLTITQLQAAFEALAKQFGQTPVTLVPFYHSHATYRGNVVGLP